MNSDSIDWTQEAELDPEKEYRALVRSIRYSRGFELLFVQCSPAEGTRLVKRVREDLPSKKIEVLTLEEAIDNLFDIVDALPNKDQIDALFIEGIERSLYEYEKEQLWNDSNERYNYSQKSIPRLLRHLNLGRERFRDYFKFCFIFLVPKFALKYLVHRAPDFFDWRSGVLEILTDPAILDRETSRLLGSHRDYVNWSQQERDRRITEIQCWAEEQQQTIECKAQLFFEQGTLFTVSEKYEAAIASYDKAVEYKLDFYDAWYNRGGVLKRLERYDEAIKSYDKALSIRPNVPVAWSNRASVLRKLGRYDEAIASNNKAIIYKPSYFRAWYNNACYHTLQGQLELTITNLEKSIDLNPKYREMAKTDPDFDSIRNDDRFQALINEHQTE